MLFFCQKQATTLVKKAKIQPQTATKVSARCFPFLSEAKISIKMPG
jgi:hypothetical protein